MRRFLVVRARVGHRGDAGFRLLAAGQLSVEQQLAVADDPAVRAPGALRHHRQLVRRAVLRRPGAAGAPRQRAGRRRARRARGAAPHRLLARRQVHLLQPLELRARHRLGPARLARHRHRPRLGRQARRPDEREGRRGARRPQPGRRHPLARRQVGVRLALRSAAAHLGAQRRHRPARRRLQRRGRHRHRRHDARGDDPGLPDGARRGAVGRRQHALRHLRRLRSDRGPRRHRPRAPDGDDARDRRADAGHARQLELLALRADASRPSTARCG